MAPKTNTKVVSSLKGKAVDILEFGQDLINKNSVVLMPGKGGDKDVATTDAASMNKLGESEGLVGLAAVLKQFSFDSRKRLILTGHSDPGGDCAANFKLSKERAEAIYCLLAGNKKRWGELAHKRHTIRDYKWIMTYFHYTMAKDFKSDTSCNPGKIDNEWDSDNKTRDAVRGFFKGIKKIFAVSIDDAEYAKKVEEDDKKRWPEYMWQAVFILYQRKIRKMLDLSRAEMKDFREKKLKFAEAGKEFLGCGYSFPMTTPDDSKYQKDKYRRVESLLFYLNDVPARTKGVPKIVCSPATDKAHVEKDCPFYHDKHFIANYLNPLEEMNMVVYHMKFNAYNPISLKNGFPRNRRIPEGLTLEAIQYVKKGGKTVKEPIKTITKFHDGIYTAKVPDDKKRKNIYFEFKAVTQLTPNLERYWIYTKDKDTEPVLVKKFDKDIKALMTPEKFHERLCYYDLPFEWRSANYFTRYKVGDAIKTYRYQTVIKSKLKLKPYGTKEADVDNPMAFSFDDIVLIDKDGKQVIKDKDQNNVDQELSANSRISLFNIYKEDLRLYKPRKDDSIQNPKVSSACYSEIDFIHEKSAGADVWRNGINKVPSNTRGIMFCGKFYSVWDKRAGQIAGTWESSKFQIKGCRAAKLNDTDVHCVYKHRANYFDSTARATLVAGNTTVITTNTKFVGNVFPGYKLIIWNGNWNGKQHTIKRVASDTSLILSTSPAGGDAVNSKHFKIKPSHNRYSADETGHFELHYIHYGTPFAEQDGYKVRSFLMIYWNGRFVKNQKAMPNPVPQGNTIQNYVVSNIDIENFERLGLKNSQDRWHQKGYVFEPAKADAAGKGKIQIKPYFFFEAKPPTRGGSHKVKVNISNDSGDGDMGITESNMHYIDYKINNYLMPVQYGGAAQFTDIDEQGPPYETLTVAHELGHAMGLWDDYAYHKGERKWPIDSCFGQYYFGMPYHHDLGAMMQTNRAPRMRLMYHFINWINDAAKDDKQIKKFLNESEYQTVMRYQKDGASKKIEFNLESSPNNYSDIYKPFKVKRNQAVGTGAVDYFLYKIGPDETPRSIKIGNNPPAFIFDGIAVICIKIGFNFINSGGNNWTANRKTNWMIKVKDRIKKLNNKFYLSGNKDDFKKNYIFFFPICLDYSAIETKHNVAAKNATEAVAHYTINVTFNNTKAVPARTAPLSTLNVGNSVHGVWIAKYVLGIDRGGNTWDTPTVAQAGFTSADFDEVKTWIRSASGLNDNSFNIMGNY